MAGKVMEFRCIADEHKGRTHLCLGDGFSEDQPGRRCK